MALQQAGGVIMTVAGVWTGQLAAAPGFSEPLIGALGRNPVFMSAFIAWAIAQVLKVLTAGWSEGKLSWKMLVSSGGMPSSHSALCMGLTAAVGIYHGVADTLFPVCVVMSCIVMYDATGVRQQAGKHAKVLNQLLQEFFTGHPISEGELKELLGHTPLQVFAGALLGVVTAIVHYLVVYGRAAEASGAGAVAVVAAAVM